MAELRSFRQGIFLLYSSSCRFVSRRASRGDPSPRHHGGDRLSRLFFQHPAGIRCFFRLFGSERGFFSGLDRFSGEKAYFDFIARTGFVKEGSRKKYGESRIEILLRYRAFQRSKYMSHAKLKVLLTQVQVFNLNHFIRL